MHTLLRLVRGQGIALLALLIACSGSAYAAKVAAKNSVVSSSIKNGAVKTVDLAPSAVNGAKLRKSAVTSRHVGPDAMTGQDVDEGTLATVPSSVSAQLGGLAWASPVGSCTPSSTTTYDLCAQTSVDMPAAGQLLLVGQVGLTHRTDNLYEASGTCQYRVDGAAVGTTDVHKNRGETYPGWFEHSPLLATAPIAAPGTVTVGVWCKDSYYSKFNDVRFMAMAGTLPES